MSRRGFRLAGSFRWHSIQFWEGKQLSTDEGLVSGQVSTGEGLVSKLVVAKGRLVSWAGYCRLSVRVLFFYMVWHYLFVYSVSHTTTDSCK